MAVGDSFDVAVIGAGVIGCAIARRFTLEGARVAILEKATDILDGASKGNSGILHTGFDAPPGSLEHACVSAGYREYLEIHERLGLPLIPAGALVLAWTDEEEARLPLLLEQARANRISDVEMLTRAQILAREPGLSPNVLAGFAVPGEHLIDPWSTPHAYVTHAVVNGALLITDCEMVGAEFDGSAWRLATSNGNIHARAVINAAGLYGDLVDEMLTGTRHFQIRPRKGQFIVYDKPAAGLVKSIVLPVPSKTTKGIVVCRTAFGNLLVGPTAEEQEDRAAAELVPEVLDSLKVRGAEIVPGLKDMTVTAIYAGLRPATEHKDYQIRAEPARHLITAGGIRSTGLTSALGTARYVHDLYSSMGFMHRPLADPVWPVANNISDYGLRRWQQANNGGIVCHCEQVTRAEIEDALAGQVPPHSPAGIKRRTRATLGRCQGFYCTAELARITHGRLKQPYARTS